MTLLKRTPRPILLATAMMMTLTGCMSTAIQGSGSNQQRSYSIEPASVVEVNGSGELILRNGTQTELLVIAQEQIHRHLQVRNEGERLIIEPEEGVHFRTDEPVQFILISNGLEHIELAGAMNLHSDGYRTDQLIIEVGGATDIDATFYTRHLTIEAAGALDAYLSGETESFTLDLAGAADVNSVDLQANDVSIALAGAGKAYVRARDTLDVSVSGASTVTYYGTPRINQRSSGASRVYSAE